MNTAHALNEELHDFVTQLIRDHANLERLLGGLEDKFRMFILDNGEEDIPEDGNESVLPALLETMEYISVYPEKWHHPAEEYAFELLLSKDISQQDKESVEKVQNQHRVLELRGKALEQKFMQIANDTVFPIRSVVDQFFDYLDLQREHLETENQLVFPLLIKELDYSEWESLGKSILPKIDPLFEKRSKNEYKVLADLIERYKTD